MEAAGEKSSGPRYERGAFAFRRESTRRNAQRFRASGAGHSKLPGAAEIQGAGRERRDRVNFAGASASEFGNAGNSICLPWAFGIARGNEPALWGGGFVFVAVIGRKFAEHV